MCLIPAPLELLKIFFARVLREVKDPGWHGVILEKLFIVCDCIKLKDCRVLRWLHRPHASEIGIGIRELKMYDLRRVKILRLRRLACDKHIFLDKLCRMILNLDLFRFHPPYLDRTVIF